MKSRYRLLAIDVDGTLLNSRNELPPANRDALHQAHEAGITVCLCTGRSLTETRGVIEQLGLDSDVGIFVFGAIVSELPAGRTLHRTPLPPPLTDRLVRHFQLRGYPVLILYDSCETGFDYRLVEGRKNVDAYQRFLKIFTDRIEGPSAPVQLLSVWQAGPCPPVRLAVIDDPEHIAETVSLLERDFTPSELKCNPIYAPNYRFHVVECFAPPVNKWYGVTQVARRLGIDRSEIVAVGDDINDLEMIAEAGLGVAMGNAIERIKSVARWHAPTQDEAGLAAVVDALLAGELKPI